jgi:hypothetical protein
MDRKIKWYLAGPMTGHPQFNYPTFYAASERLRDIGLKVYSPAEMDDEVTVAAALASPDGSADDYASEGKGTWGEFLARDVRMIADDLGGIILLPEWETSRGARLEAFVALNCGYPAYYYIDGVCVEAYYKDIMEKINEGVL